MEGSVRKKGSRWYYSFELPSIDGKRKRIERCGGKTKKEALEALNEAMYKYANGFVEPKKLTYDAYVTDWLEDYIKENRKINTYERYKSIYEHKIKPYIWQYLLKDLKPILIEKLLSAEKKKGLSNTTLEGIYGVINNSLNRAVRLQIINDNICKFIEKPKRNKFISNTLSIDEFNLLLSSLDPNEYADYAFKLCLIVTMELGLRRGEVAGLEWSNIDFASNIVNITNNLIYTNTSVEIGTPKTIESERSISISNELLDLLKSHKKIQNLNKLEYGENYIKNKFNNREYDFIFTWKSGQYIHPNYYTLKFRRLVEKSGLNKKVRFHDLRHSNATLLLQEGIDFKIIQTRLGHSDISTTLNIYSHVTNEMQKSATEKLSNLLFPSKINIKK
ncbi:site-specific integrase [Clostridium beijerinckii]|uniref:Site-specific integrase n=1 Tax=Clostridium beijerinckii TaxID=1520 RepID=A0AB74VI96_CLOBE|nr:tyrosine-type recombinase/integrase [Clostridium beijerinckii]NRZ25354.1 integrase [Clostridium beijerinckii]NYB97871.1 integrase [Clostridium beijerinckii]OOM25854.1 tyrosine recombinase XerD [Clostridium beijerinckii]QUN36126.1 site-specific integrase [Clostridium beijerinckii]SQB13177.1 prophage LambdaBa04, site-specific recombinase, phage integrase family [Clostridium beijerinckii]